MTRRPLFVVAVVSMVGEFRLGTDARLRRRLDQEIARHHSESRNDSLRHAIIEAMFATAL